MWLRISACNNKLITFGKAEPGELELKQKQSFALAIEITNKFPSTRKFEAI